MSRSFSILLAACSVAGVAYASDEAVRAHTGAALEVHLPAARTIWVPPGWFTFGASDEEQAAALALCQHDVGALPKACTPELFANEGPARNEYLPGFFLDREEVTVGAYRRCVDAGRCDPRPLVGADPRMLGARFPVTNVSWFDADRYCTFVGGSLPTELEWERAARGPRPRIFPWGDSALEDRSNHGRFEVLDANSPYARPMVRVDESDGYVLAAPPGSFPAGASPEGFVDMAGNVAEWVADAVGDDGPLRGKPGTLPLGARRMLRGGSFRQPLLYQRTTAWDAALPEQRSPEVGFRCVDDKYGPAKK
jgi:formylglycine-generating enzyme required for sulfatase activity